MSELHCTKLDRRSSFLSGTEFTPFYMDRKDVSQTIKKKTKITIIGSH